MNLVSTGSSLLVTDTYQQAEIVVDVTRNTDWNYGKFNFFFLDVILNIELSNM
jgi:hypothetical protein